MEKIMKLFTSEQLKKLLANGKANRQRQEQGLDEIDFKPVVKLFTPDGGATWLLTEIDPDEPDIAFGLCDLGMGFPELGNVSLAELAEVRGQLGLPIERDKWFEADKTLSAYAEEARKKERIDA
jgi:hypothetical protein